MRGQILVIFAQTTIQTQPTEGAFHHPTARQHFEPFLVGGFLDNLKKPARKRFEPGDQLAPIRPVRPKQDQTRKPALQFGGRQARSLRIADLRARHDNRKQQTEGIDNDMAFAPFDQFTAIETDRTGLPPFSVVLTDWLSTMAALGVVSLPS